MAQNQDFLLPYNSLSNLVPQNMRTPMLESLLSNLFDRFLTHDESIPLYGYVGRKPASPDDRAPRVPQPNAERDINSVIPVLSFKVGAERVSYTIQDLMRKADAIGISPGDWQWLYSQGNNYVPPINLDKFTNFFNYYWVAKAIPASPTLPWNPELLPEYYTIAAPLPGDPQKLNVVAASTGNTVLTGTGFNKLSFLVHFTDPNTFTITPVGSLGAFTPNQSTFVLTSNNQHVEYRVSGLSVPLIEFDVIRDEILNEAGEPDGFATFAAGYEFLIDVTFLTGIYTVKFIGSTVGAVKGKITGVQVLNQYQKLDGVQLRSGDRVLIKNNSAADDGIYVVSPGNWERAEDFTGTTRAAGAHVFVTDGLTNKNKMFKSIEGAGGFGWEEEVGITESSTNDWQEGNYWAHRTELIALGVERANVQQAVRPIIEYSADVQLNTFVQDGRPADVGVLYKQVKTEFNQLPLFDLFRYDGTHAGLVSSVFYYEEDLTEELDLKLQKRVLKSTNDSADFIFNHGMADETGQLLFIKRNGELKTIWHAGYLEPTVVDVNFVGTGNGTCTNIVPYNFTEPQVWTLTATSESTFSIKGSKLPVLPSPFAEVIIGTPYNNMELSLMINEGDVPFVSGDVFSIRIGNLESSQYVYRDANDNIFTRFGGPAEDLYEEGAWQVPRMFYNNPYNESRSSVTEGVLYSHFREILANEVQGIPDYSFGGSIKLWSEQQTLVAALLMQRDMTPISMIDLAQKQYQTALNTVIDIFQQRIVQFLGDYGTVQIDELLTFIQTIRANDHDVRTVLFDSTSPLLGFPATLPQLGITKLVQPVIEFDKVLGRTLLTHHDGHKTALYTDGLDFRQSILGNLTTLEILRSDGTLTPAVGSFGTAPVNPYKGELWIKPDGSMFSYNVDSDLLPPPLVTGALWYKRDISKLFKFNGAEWEEVNAQTPWVPIDLAATLNLLLLHVELKLYEGINPNARIYNFSEIMSDIEFKSQLKKELFTYAAQNAYDPLAPDYVPSDPFTWNYSQASLDNLPSLPSEEVPARWHNLLKAHQSTIAGVIPTERPNLEPWKLLGIEVPTAGWLALYRSPVHLDDITDTFIDGGSVKVVKTTAEITILNGLQIIDGIQLVPGDTVLLQNELNPQNNGIWVVSSSNWVRDLVPLVQNLYITVTDGFLNKNSTWVLTASADVTDPVNFIQARLWKGELWDLIKAARPGLKLSVDARNDSLLPPYVSTTSGWSINALTTVIPSGTSLSYAFGEDSPIEAVWKRSLEYGYSLARALFRFDPLAFLGFCWGINWVEVDSILYDGFDLNMPRHKRFRLHGEPIEVIDRSPMNVALVPPPPEIPITMSINLAETISMQLGIQHDFEIEESIEEDVTMQLNVQRALSMEIEELMEQNIILDVTSEEQTVIFRDTFTGTGSITDHTPDVASTGAWVESGQNPGLPLLAEGKLSANETAGTLHGVTYNFTPVIMTFPYAISITLASSVGNGSDPAGYASRVKFFSNVSPYDFVDVILDADMAYFTFQHESDIPSIGVSVTPGEHAFELIFTENAVQINIDGIPATLLEGSPPDTPIANPIIFPEYMEGSPRAFDGTFVNLERNWDGVGGSTSVSLLELVLNND